MLALTLHDPSAWFLVFINVHINFVGVWLNAYDVQRVLEFHEFGVPMVNAFYTISTPLCLPFVPIPFVFDLFWFSGVLLTLFQYLTYDFSFI